MIRPARLMGKRVQLKPQGFSAPKAKGENATKCCRQEGQRPAWAPRETAHREPEQAATGDHEDGEDEKGVWVGVQC